jgi:hypothetical protein
VVALDDVRLAGLRARRLDHDRCLNHDRFLHRRISNAGAFPARFPA